MPRSQRAIAAPPQRGASAGAWLAMDPRDGSILAHGLRAELRRQRVRQAVLAEDLRALTSQATGAPLLNRATESAYPTGSTFKPITALAALETGLITPSTTINDNGSWELGTQNYQNAERRAFGTIDVSDALKVSSDIFFFQLGAQADDKGPTDPALGARLGFGRQTGIDLPGEPPGLVPDADWRDRGLRGLPRRAREGHVTAGTQAALYKCGGIDKTVDDGRQRQPRRRPGRPAGHAAAARGRLLGAGQRRHDRAPAPRPGDRGRQRCPDPATHAPSRGARSRSTRATGSRARRPARAPPARRAARRPTCSRASRSTTVYGKTGTAERAPNPDQAWYAVLRQRPATRRSSSS